MGHFTYLRPQVLRVFEVKARVQIMFFVIKKSYFSFGKACARMAEVAKALVSKASKLGSNPG